MGAPAIDRALVERLYRRARAERWNLPQEALADALTASVARAFADETPARRELERYLDRLHLEDLALASACAAGHDAAWEHFVLEYRPVLYRAADAIAPGGRGREIADSLYAELFGLQERSGARASLFRYYHGRSSMATWLRVVLAQRHVDLVRSDKRVEPLPEDESPAAPAAQPEADPARPRYQSLVTGALAGALARLEPRDRLRLGCYYAEDLTLAQIGRILDEHESSVSRNLARTRRAMRDDIERQLRVEHHLHDLELRECLAAVMDDAGPMNLGELLGSGGARKKSGGDRSI